MMHISHISFGTFSFKTEYKIYVSPKTQEICGYKARYKAILANRISMSSLKVSIWHTKFSTIPCNRIRDRTVIRIMEKVVQQLPIQIYLYPKGITFISNSTYFVHTFFCIFIHCKTKICYSQKVWKKYDYSAIC